MRTRCRLHQGQHPCVPTNRNYANMKQPPPSKADNVTPLFRKLNLKHLAQILVRKPPATFETELSAPSGVEIVTDTDEMERVAFVLAFVMTRVEVTAVAPTVAKKTLGDGVVWSAYPKVSPKRYRCDFNRDPGWQVLGDPGFEGVRQVAIDDDWCALSFRRVEFVRTMSCDTTRAMTSRGEARVSASNKTEVRLGPSQSRSPNPVRQTRSCSGSQNQDREIASRMAQACVHSQQPGRMPWVAGEVLRLLETASRSWATRESRSSKAGRALRCSTSYGNRMNDVPAGSTRPAAGRFDLPPDEPAIERVRVGQS